MPPVSRASGAVRKRRSLAGQAARFPPPPASSRREAPVAPLHRPRTSQRSPDPCGHPHPPAPPQSLPPGWLSVCPAPHGESSPLPPPAVTCRNSPGAGRCWGPRILPRGGSDQHRLPRLRPAGKPRSRSPPPTPGDARGPPHRAAAASPSPSPGPSVSPRLRAAAAPHKAGWGGQGLRHPERAGAPRSAPQAPGCGRCPGRPYPRLSRPHHRPRVSFIPCRGRRGSGSAQGCAWKPRRTAPFRAVPARPGPPAVPAPARPPRRAPLPGGAGGARGMPAAAPSPGGCPPPPWCGSLSPQSSEQPSTGRSGPAARRCPSPGRHLRWGLRCCCRGESPSVATAKWSSTSPSPGVGEPARLGRRVRLPTTINAAGGSPRYVPGAMW